MNMFHRDQSQRLLMYDVVPSSRKSAKHVQLLLTAVYTGLLLMFLFLAGTAQLQAQCGDGTHTFCDDSCCQTDAVLLNSGFNHGTGRLYDYGTTDGYWVITEDNSNTTSEPRGAFILDPAMVDMPTPYPNSRWISANSSPLLNVSSATFEKCFCLCEEAELTFTMNVTSNADVNIPIYVDGILVANAPPNPVTFTQVLGPGRHCISITITNAGPWAALNVQGTIQGPGLLKPNCCAGPPTEVLSACQTDHLQLITDHTWTIESGPAAAGSFPRCADIAPAGPAISGANWIAPNTNESSVHPGTPNLTQFYVYRKTFCVDRSGTFIITITSSADDIGDIYLNGVLLGPTGGRGAPTTQTFVVGLNEGCNCFEFHVGDMLACCTGMSAIIDIQGGILLDESCCNDCGGCGSQPNGGPGMDDQDEENRLSGVLENVNANSAVARPILVSIPNPTTGESVVHYVLDRDADARVELYNSAGQLMMTLDEGARKIGKHAVNMDTKGLAAGAYRLLLVYGDRKLSVPVTVR